jgi:hypothetical protein
MTQWWQTQREAKILPLEAGLLEERSRGRGERGFAVDVIDDELTP